MKINPTTLLFEDLTDEEADVLHGWIESLVKGIVSLGTDPFFEEWRKVGGFDDRQVLLVYSTVYPQRALLSIVRHLRAQKT